MPYVSILIPAYRPDYFDACMASALAQTFRDIEVIVSDDCPTNAIAGLLEKWDDPRIQYERNPTPGRYATNQKNALRLATGRYLKYLFDDDLLYPQSVEMLVNAAKQAGAKLAFHHRHFVDTTGRILAAPTVLPYGTVGIVPATQVYAKMIGKMFNFIGEPSNVLIDAEALDNLELPFEIAGYPARFLTDVAMIYNFARAGYPIVGVGRFGSAFRQHASQSSSETAPTFAAGVFEWELLARSALADGHLSSDEFRGALDIVHGVYRRLLDRHPLFSRFLVLDGNATPQSALDENFRQAVELAYLEVDVRNLPAVLAVP